MDRNDLIGKPLAEAAKLIKDAGMTYRIVAEDGKHYMVTCDFVSSRFDIETRDGIVVDA